MGSQGFELGAMVRMAHGPRDGHRDLRPLSQLALHLDRTLVRLGDGAADGQAQPVSPGPPAAGGIDPVEPVEDEGEMFRGDADPGIAHDDASVARLGIPPGGGSFPRAA